MKDTTTLGRRPIRWRRVIALAAFGSALALVLVPLGMGALPMWALLHPSCWSDSLTPASYGLPSYQDISIPGRHGSGSVYRGFFVRGTKDATIILPPPYSVGRMGMLREGSLLAKTGFNILTYDSRVCSGSNVTTLGYAEAQDVGDVLAYLAQNDDGIHVNMDHIALHGFSAGGAAALMAGARFPQIRAILAEGGYDDADQTLGWHNATTPFNWLMVAGAEFTYRVSTGQDASILKPVDAIQHIPPRAVYLVYGSQESSLPGAKDELAASLAASTDAPIPPRLWIVPGAGHGGYTNAVGEEEYIRHVAPFYDCALLNHCDSWNTLWNTVF
ncbi:MAG TPA: prolyl oligopeptidase family serine peptidase [Aggregatilineales bacterium]|nr:prolyl oligopeptidase family serine peptidase [Aggregatilineales bacterium]